MSGPDYKEVTSTTGQIWLDRNLGAARVATSQTDTEAYGDLYQWGRLTDGHEKRSSLTTTENSSTDVPGHGYFILEGDAPYDWRIPQSNSLWQDVSGSNNPCPGGFRLPTEMELDAERATWSPDNATGAFDSPLKFVLTGFRYHYIDAFDLVGTWGRYWTSTRIWEGDPINAYRSRNLSFDNTSSTFNTAVHAIGQSVRCIRD